MKENKEVFIGNVDKLAMELAYKIIKNEDLPAKKRHEKLLQDLRKYLTYSENYGYQQAMVGANLVDGMW